MPPLLPSNGASAVPSEAARQAHCRTLAPGETRRLWLELEDFPRRVAGRTYTGASP